MTVATVITILGIEKVIAVVAIDAFVASLRVKNKKTIANISIILKIGAVKTVFIFVSCKNEI